MFITLLAESKGKHGHCLYQLSFSEANKETSARHEQRLAVAVSYHKMILPASFLVVAHYFLIIRN